MAAKDSRVNLTNEVLTGIRLIKLYAWEGDFLQRINSLRSKELQELMACVAAMVSLNVGALATIRQRGPRCKSGGTIFMAAGLEWRIQAPPGTPSAQHHTFRRVCVYAFFWEAGT
jgi:hypothetical protein